MKASKWLIFVHWSIHSLLVGKTKETTLPIILSAVIRRSRHLVPFASFQIEDSVHRLILLVVFGVEIIRFIVAATSRVNSLALNVEVGAICENAIDLVWQPLSVDIQLQTKRVDALRNQIADFHQLQSRILIYLLNRTYHRKLFGIRIVTLNFCWRIEITVEF